MCLSLLAACGGTHTNESGSPPKVEASSTPDGALPAIEDIVEAGGSRFEVLAADWIQVVDGSAWTTLASAATVRLAPQDGKETARVPTAAESCLSMDVAFDSVWVGICSEPATILRLDARTGKVLASIRLPGRLLVLEGSIGAGLGSVWAVTMGRDEGVDRILFRIDPATNRVASTSPAPDLWREHARGSAACG